MSYPEIRAACVEAGLEIVAAFHPSPEAGAPDGCQTLLLLGPHEPGFWARIQSSPEATGPDPVDRWSVRVIGALAESHGAVPLFPFGGPPYHPFFRWALASGMVWQSPVSLLVHDRAGLFVSFRGALAFHKRLTLPRGKSVSPCLSCQHKPCLTACPASALTASGYDVPACHTYLDTEPTQDCISRGCQTRRSCPASQSYGRLDAQSAHHMRHFHKGTP